MDFLSVLTSFERDGIAVADNFISEENADRLLTYIQSLTLKEAGIGNKGNLQVNKKIRGDKIAWIAEEDKVFHETYLHSLKELMQGMNRGFYLGLKESEHHIACYEPGTHYEKHVDTFKGSNARVISTVLYLNKNWRKEDGGCLVLYPEGRDSIIIEPLCGRLALFESTIPHEVLTSNTYRYSITGWLKR